MSKAQDERDNLEKQFSDKVAISESTKTNQVQQERVIYAIWTETYLAVHDLQGKMCELNFSKSRVIDSKFESS